MLNRDAEVHFCSRSSRHKVTGTSHFSLMSLIRLESFITLQPQIPTSQHPLIPRPQPQIKLLGLLPPLIIIPISIRTELKPIPHQDFCADQNSAHHKIIEAGLSLANIKIRVVASGLVLHSWGQEDEGLAAAVDVDALVDRAVWRCV